MTTLRIPDLVGAAHKLRRGIYPEHGEALQAAEEWLARLAISFSLTARVKFKYLSRIATILWSQLS